MWKGCRTHIRPKKSRGRSLRGTFRQACINPHRGSGGRSLQEDCRMVDQTHKTSLKSGPGSYFGKRWQGSNTNKADRIGGESLILFLRRKELEACILFKCSLTIRSKLCLIKQKEKGYPRSVLSRFTRRVGAERLSQIIEEKVIKLLKENRAAEVDAVLDATFIKAWSTPTHKTAEEDTLTEKPESRAGELYNWCGLLGELSPARVRLGTFIIARGIEHDLH